jgi:NADH dehydrogenase
MGPSLYLRSKARGEQALIRTLDQTSTELTILRPSVIFGQDDRFLNVFAQLQAFTPVVPLACAQAQFQPVWVQDVVSATLFCLHIQPLGTEFSGSCKGRIGPKAHRIFELAGPEVLSLKALVQIAGRASGHRRWVLELPRWVAWLQAFCFELLPGEPLMSRDNVASMSVANICSNEFPGLKACGVLQAKRVESIFPALDVAKPAAMREQNTPKP